MTAPPRPRADRSELGFALVIAFLLTPFTTVIGGLVLVTLWRWFALPLGAPPIGVAHAVGIYLLVGLVAPKPVSSTGATDDPLDRLGNWLGDLIVRWGVYLAIGWVALQFMEGAS